MSQILFEQLLDEETSTYTYLIADQISKECALVDTVKEQISVYTSKISSLGFHLKYLLETHVHADHVTANGLLKENFPSAQIAVAHSGVKCEHVLLKDGQILLVGNIEIQAIFTPGHTSDSVSFLVDKNRLLTGDTLFINSCGRTDFQAGDSKAMFHSLKKLSSFSPDTLIYPGHDYNGRWVSTVREQLGSNPLLRMNEHELQAELASWKLPPPKKIRESVPANLNCGIEKN